MKTAVLTFTEHQNPVDRGHMAHVLHLGAELKRAGQDFVVIFAGKSVEWLPQLTNPNRHEEHPFIKNYGHLFDEFRDHVHVCNFCSIRFGAKEQVQAAGLKIEGEGKAHMELSTYVLEGWNIVRI